MTRMHRFAFNDPADGGYYHCVRVASPATLPATTTEVLTVAVSEGLPEHLATRDNLEVLRYMGAPGGIPQWDAVPRAEWDVIKVTSTREVVE